MRPGYRAECLDAAVLDARARARADLHALDDVDRRDLTEEVGELRVLVHRCAVHPCRFVAKKVHGFAPLRIHVLGRSHAGA
jgi:hypothetical protein